MIGIGKSVVVEIEKNVSELVDYVEEQRSLERYRARREQMIDQAGMLTRWKWKFTGVPVDEPDEIEE